MATSTDTSSSNAGYKVPRYRVAGRFVEGLGSQDFDLLGSALAEDVHLRALVPPGLKEWDGKSRVQAAFAAWFGDTEAFEVVDTTVGDVGPRLHLRWRLRLQAQRLGPGWFLVEQQVYADTDTNDRIRNMSLLCTGYCVDTAGV